MLQGFRTRPAAASDWAALIAAAASAATPAAPLDMDDQNLFNPPSMRAAIDAQLQRRGARIPRDLASYVKLVCASIAVGHAGAKLALERLSGKAFKRLLIVGGGSQNRLLCQDTATASGVPVASYALEGAAVGNIASQLLALGAVENLEEFRAKFRRQLRCVVYSP